MVTVSILNPVHACWEDQSWLLLEVSISALGAAFRAFVEGLSCEGSDLQRIASVVGRLVEIAEGLISEGAGHQAGSNERLLHLNLIIMIFL